MQRQQTLNILFEIASNHSQFLCQYIVDGLEPGFIMHTNRNNIFLRVYLSSTYQNFIPNVIYMRLICAFVEYNMLPEHIEDEIYNLDDKIKFYHHISRHINDITKLFTNFLEINHNMFNNISNDIN